MLREKLIFFILIIPKSIWQKIFTTELAPTLKDVGKITGASKTILSFGITVRKIESRNCIIRIIFYFKADFRIYR